MKKHMVEEDVYILAIESSCDETAAAVVKNGRQDVATALICIIIPPVNSLILPIICGNTKRTGLQWENGK